MVDVFPFIKIAVPEDAASILNSKMDDVPQLMDRGGTFGKLFPRIIMAEESEARALLPELRKKATELSELLWEYPPFSLNQKTDEQELLDDMLADECLTALRDPPFPGT